MGAFLLWLTLTGVIAVTGIAFALVSGELDRLLELIHGHEARLKTLESLMSARGLLPDSPREAETGVERLTNVRTTGIRG